jgi:hypothetical protein
VNLLPYNIEAGHRNLKYYTRLEQVEQKVRAEEGLVDRDYNNGANIYKL